MNTQALSGPANLLNSAPQSGNAVSQPETAELAFNQVLQREVRERSSTDQASKPETRQSAEKSPNQDSAAPASDGAGKSGAVTAKNKDEAETTDETEELSDAANASAELLALVAGMAQINSRATGAKSTGSDSGTTAQLDPAAALGKGKAIALNAEEQAAKALPADGLHKTDDLPGVDSDFAQAAKELGKGAGNAAQTQQFSATPLATGQTGATPLDSLETAGLSSEAGTTPSVLPPMQQALNKVHAATTQAADTLAPPVGTPAWDQAVGQKVVWMVAGAQQSASLTLNPPDLGPMQIVLNVNNSQANATFVAAQPEVRQALEAALPKLREMLGDAGIQLGQANINAGTPQQGNNGFDQDGRPASTHFAQSADSEQPLAPVRQPSIRQGLGMVDTFA